ncbi:F-box/kelch-repeat protein SKIP25 [Ziziphus jujuba]|uniref:F-box/kelch-repeat protein SKIP25 n=1 Tax=Ziziphus jujuba TaxID=326968 RepID=A0A6P4AJ68_ZIZJJ|nr:F-box/kelch-repeat protein SKIP25 [Ziziphus jujuba]
MANPISPPPQSPSSSSCSSKRRKLSHNNQPQALIPGLPDHLAQVCLSLVHPSFLYSVCRSWRRLIYSSSFPPFLSLYALLSTTNPSPPNEIRTRTQQQQPEVHFSCFDPISSAWQALPSPPTEPPHRLLLHHPCFISRNLPIQTVSVCGELVLLAATSDDFVPALPRPLIFNPLSKSWKFGPNFSAPRRWCAAGALRGSVYVASGIGTHYSIDVARSAERLDLKNNWEWERLSGLRDGRFSREAIEAVGWRGKLCMVNVKGSAAKNGVVYNMEADVWEDMPDGMIAGWRGPVAAMDEEEMFVVDERDGALRKYDTVRDCWIRIMESDRLIGAVQMVAGGGRVCAVSAGGGEIVVVDVAVSPASLWVVDIPSGLQALAVHILPRMTRP